jgi:hypothetical protein
MLGDLRVNPNSLLKTGYAFTLPGNKLPFSARVVNPKVVFTLRCVSGAAASPSTLTAAMLTKSYPVFDSSWIPTEDSVASIGYQGTVTVPNACGGGQVRLDKGGTFTAQLLLS